MNPRLETLFTSILVVAACAVAITVVRGPRESTPTRNSLVSTPPEYIPSWEDGLQFGHVLAGRDSAPLTLMVLADLECAACAAFDLRLTEVLERRADQVRVVFLHFPLPYHRFALPAARAAECAAQYGLFKEWVDAIYTRQDSLGLKPWSSYAAEIGVMDSLAIQTCALESESGPKIAGGLEFGKRIGLVGTPTVILNGWRFNAVPSTS